MLNLAARQISPTTVSPLPESTPGSGTAPASKSKPPKISSAGTQVAALASLQSTASTSNSAFKPSSSKLARRHSTGSDSSDAARLKQFRAEHPFKGTKTAAPKVGGSAGAPLAPAQINHQGQDNPSTHKLERRNSMESIGAYSSDPTRLEQFRADLKEGKVKAYGVEKSAAVTFTPAQIASAQKMVEEAFVQAFERLKSEGTINDNTTINFPALEEKIEPPLLKIIQSPISDDEKKEALQGLMYKALDENIKHDAAPVAPEAAPPKPGQTQYAPPSSPPLDPKAQAAMEASMQQMTQQYSQLMQQMMQLQTMYMNFISSLIQTMAQTLEKGNHAMTGGR